jgi:predicted GNAT superfamily acetyltransferase
MNAPTARILARRLETFAEQRAAAGLYRSVFGYADEAFGVSPRLLRGLLDNGGTALGAFEVTEDEERIVGFCYGFTAIGEDGPYHYSQATVVAPDAQRRGIGRMLKEAQAEEARMLGARSMRWTFDPALARNASFNLNGLGAHGLAFRSTFYGEPGTDRMLVDWPLDPGHAERNRARAAELALLVDDPSAISEQGLHLVALPTGAPELEGAFTAGRSALACVKNACDTSVYVFGRA